MLATILQMKYYNLTFFVLLTFLSCNKVQKQEFTISENFTELDSVTSIINYFEINPSWNYINNKIGNCIGDTIDSQLKIRFSTTGTLLQSNKFLNLSYKDGKWNAIIGNKPLLLGESEYSKKIEPLIGWEKFEDSLIKIDIRSLKTYDIEQKRIEDTMLDGESMVIEIITSNEYKIYSFNNPRNLISKSSESHSLKKFKRLYELINHNFENHYEKL